MSFIALMTGYLGACTLDAFIHCRAIELGYTDTDKLEKARNYVWDRYKLEEVKPYDMGNLLSYLQEKRAIQGWEQVTEGSVGDAIVFETGPGLGHASCIVGETEEYYHLALGSSMGYKYFPKKEPAFFYRRW